ncbi:MULTISPECIES: DUF4112 domain-containing protein [Leisingera]|jgi:hypothetical protein|uniref:DUF4112 domain-containing protein n=1 Tax=Leisingera TaxID=191028 RepID=UPI00114F1165|nr:MULTISPECIES: DUF4112 domain-containing protein [Leisingera]QDI75573.1 DUF4112 domain-containing protein [Leisingera aquaemixtae]
MPDLPHHHEQKLQSLERLAQRMDRAFRIPGIGLRVGWDSIAGLVPGIGDALSLAPAGYILYSGYQLGASAGTLARMAANTGIDALIGSVPLVGDLFDIAWKSNTRNTELLRRHLEDTASRGEPLPKRLGRRAFSKLTAPREFGRSLSYARNRPGPQQKQPGIRQHPLNRFLDP